MTEFRVGMRPYKVIAWVCIAFFMFCFVASWRAGQSNVSPWFLIFVGMGVLMLCNASHIKFTEKTISVFSPFAEYQLAWEKIDWIEHGNQGTLVLHGQGNKRLVIPSAAMWSGAAKPSAYKFLGDQIEEREITVVPSSTAEYKIHKNVRVKNA